MDVESKEIAARLYDAGSYESHQTRSATYAIGSLAEPPMTIKLYRTDPGPPR